MTALPGMTGFTRAGAAPTARAETELFAVDETYWGYIVRSNEPETMGVFVMQSLAWLIGISCVVASLGLWLLPSAVMVGPAMGMKLGASVVTGAMAALCLWFASRGTQVEIQIDTRLGEVREVVRNKAGKASMVGRYGFDAIGGVYIDGAAASRGLPSGNLVLRYRNTAQTLHVASGDVIGLAALRDRLGRDLMVLPRNPLRADVEAPLQAA